MVLALDQLFIGRPQFFFLGLELFGLGLRYPQQFAGLLRRLDRTDGDTGSEDNVLEQVDVIFGEQVQTGQLQNAEHLGFELDGNQEQRNRFGLTQAGHDLDVVAGRTRHLDPVALQGTLPHQTVAESERSGQTLAAVEGIRGGQGVTAGLVGPLQIKSSVLGAECLRGARDDDRAGGRQIGHSLHLGHQVGLNLLGKACLFADVGLISETLVADVQIGTHGFRRIGEHRDLTRTDAANRPIIGAVGDCGDVLQHAADRPGQQPARQPDGGAHDGEHQGGP